VIRRPRPRPRRTPGRHPLLNPYLSLLSPREHQRPWLRHPQRLPSARWPRLGRSRCLARM